MWRATCLAVAVCVGLQTTEGEVASVTNLYVSGNPHMPAQPNNEKTAGAQCYGSAGGCPAEFLDMTGLVMAPRSLPTQFDTFVRMFEVKYLGIDVQVYQFKQPKRLHVKELPFKIVLSRTLNTDGLKIIPVDFATASDSWYPGYHWSVVVCQKCGGATHLGWKYTNNNDPNDAFYALIVNFKDEPKQAEASGESLIELVAEQLTVGMRGPAWVMSLLADTMAMESNI